MNQLEERSRIEDKIKVSKSRKLFYQHVIRDYQRSLKSVEKALAEAQADYDRVKEYFANAPGMIAEMEIEIRRAEKLLKRNVMVPKLEKILQLKAEIERLERETE